jgi:predicted SAM-dependent methyltransferase
MTPILLNLGAGTREYHVEGYVNIDSQPYEGIDVVCRIPKEQLPYADGSVAHIYCGHMVEHLPPWDVLPTLLECRRVLAKGGTLTLVCPDADKARLRAESHLLTVTQYALMIHGARHDDMPHTLLLNRKRLEQALTQAAFKINGEYDWRNDERVYDRTVKTQCGAQGVK